MILAIVALVSATFQPAAPTVGDPIVVQFDVPVVLEASPSYEIVEQKGNRAVVRSFEPKPFKLIGKAGGVPFENIVVPMKSVLKPKDDLKPAPLVPPKAIAWPRAPWYAMAIAAAVAALAWLAAWWASKRKVAASIEPAVPADVRFRRAVDALRANRNRRFRWAGLADATRVYLAATRPDHGTELTTAELLRRLTDDDAVTVREILRQGDLEKFSPWGPPTRDFDSLAAQALELARPKEEAEVAA
jgi:hypothetical protein